MLAIEGIPIFYLELAIGQRLRKGAIGVWNQVNREKIINYIFTEIKIFNSEFPYQKGISVYGGYRNQQCHSLFQCGSLLQYYYCLVPLLFRSGKNLFIINVSSCRIYITKIKILKSV